jgi:hypothetical protein
MKRRSFVKISVLTGAAATILPELGTAKSSNKKSDRCFYELRVYSFTNAAQQVIVEDYLKNALIPALNRIGSKNVGVFTELEVGRQTKLFVLIPYPSIEDFITQDSKLTTDAVYLEQSAAYLNAPLATPVYERIESSLLQAFTRMLLCQKSHRPC